MAEVPLPAVTITTTNAKTISARWKGFTDSIEASLANIPPLVELEKAFKISKLHCVFLCVVTIVWAVLVIKNICGGPLTDLVGFSYPAYASIKSVDSGDKVKYTQWLAYWVVFGIFKTLENFHMMLLQMLPFYFFFKAMFLTWAMSKYSMGAYKLYHSLIKHWIPFLDRTFGSMLGGVMSEAIKASAEAAVKPPEPMILPPAPAPPVPRAGQITLTAPGTNFRATTSRWGYTTLGLRGR
ncbi:hypothetical protein HK105_203629 [Polyrhizophydium stewartii]|uniref:Protein YOP1 n=1 Tax=Polyrhizophydium stewartii TaxID=2732419 RepID=A0ABR4NBE0_9FUNG|nr:hypothetical protein HK105_007595 [Polyrhizophydium stewartii]